MEYEKQAKALRRDYTKKYKNIDASITFRKNVIDSSKRANYIHEYDRIKGVYDKKLQGLNMAQHVLDSLEGRMYQLKKITFSPFSFYYSVQLTYFLKTKLKYMLLGLL